jgi:hypothetical protein
MEALTASGFQVSMDRLRPDALSSLQVRREVADDDGQRYVVQVNGLTHHLDEMIHEFRGIDYLVEVARVMFHESFAAMKKSDAWSSGRDG